MITWKAKFDNIIEGRIDETKIYLNCKHGTVYFIKGEKKEKEFCPVGMSDIELTKYVEIIITNKLNNGKEIKAN